MDPVRKVKEIIEPGASLDAENVCGLTGKFIGGASELERCRRAARDGNGGAKLSLVRFLLAPEIINSVFNC